MQFDHLYLEEIVANNLIRKTEQFQFKPTYWLLLAMLGHTCKQTDK